MKASAFFLFVLIFTCSKIGQAQVVHPIHQSSIKGSGALLYNPTAVSITGNLASIISFKDKSFVMTDISDPHNPVFKSTLPLSGPLCVFASGNYAYVGNFLGGGGYSIIVVDISDPTHPVVKSSIKDGDGGAIIQYPTSIYVKGNYAYVTNAGSSVDTQSLEILDISDSDHPIHVGKIESGTNGALLDDPSSVVVSGNYAYVASYFSNALEIIDVSNPGAPIEVGHLISGTGGAIINRPLSVFVSGNYAYLTSCSGLLNDGNNAIEIVDITDPINPVHKGKIENGDGGAKLYYPYNIVVSGNYAYVASQLSNALEIIDVSNPAAPTHAASLADGLGGAMMKGPSSIALSSGLLYVASTGSDALEVVDVSNPMTPTHAGKLVDGAGGNGAKLNSPSAVFVSGKYAYVAAINSLEIVDISHPDTPAHVGAITNGTNGAIIDFPTSVFVSGNFAYIANSSSNSLEIVDVTNPSMPTHRGSITDGTGGVALKSPSAVFVKGNYAYVAAKNSNVLEVIDVSNSATPTHTGSISGLPQFLGPYYYGLISSTALFVSGNYAYVVGMDALEIVDISNPSSPKHKGSLRNGDGSAIISSPQSIFVKGNYAYVLCYHTLEIIDVSSPSSPIHVASISDGDGGAILTDAYSIYVSGHYACIANRNTKSIEVIDVGNPSASVHVANIANGIGGALLDVPLSVSFLNGYAFVASNNSNALEIISILAPPVSMDAANITSSSFDTRWHKSDGATGYQLDVSMDNFLTFLPGFNSVVVNDTMVNIAGLTSGTTYQYRIRAYNALDVTENSNSTSVITIPSPPNALPASLVGLNSFRAVWNKSKGAAGYQLDVSVDNFQTYLKNYHSILVADTVLDVAGLLSGFTYQYRVRAYNISGVSANSNTVSPNTHLIPVNALPASQITASSFVANWNKSQGATGYRLDVSQDNFQTYLTNYNSKTVLDTIFVVDGVSSGANYQYRVRAYNSFEITPNSNVILVTIIPAPPHALPASVITSSSFRANWNKSKGAAGYQLDVSSDNFKTYLKNYNAIVVSDTTLEVVGILSGIAFQYRVRSFNSSGLSANSNAISDVITGDIKTTASIFIYPNPASNHFSISGIESPITSISITDNMGRSFPVDFDYQNLMVSNLHHLSAGVYVVNISCDVTTYRIKLVKN